MGKLLAPIKNIRNFSDLVRALEEKGTVASEYHWNADPWIMKKIIFLGRVVKTNEIKYRSEPEIGHRDHDCLCCEIVPLTKTGEELDVYRVVFIGDIVSELSKAQISVGKLIGLLNPAKLKNLLHRKSCVMGPHNCFAWIFDLFPSSDTSFMSINEGEDTAHLAGHSEIGSAVIDRHESSVRDKILSEKCCTFCDCKISTSVGINRPCVCSCKNNCCCCGSVKKCNHCHKGQYHVGQQCCTHCINIYKNCHCHGHCHIQHYHCSQQYCHCSTVAKRPKVNYKNSSGIPPRDLSKCDAYISDCDSQAESLTLKRKKTSEKHLPQMRRHVENYKNGKLEPKRVDTIVESDTEMELIYSPKKLKHDNCKRNSLEKKCQNVTMKMDKSVNKTHLSDKVESSPGINIGVQTSLNIHPEKANENELLSHSLHSSRICNSEKGVSECKDQNQDHLKPDGKINNNLSRKEDMITVHRFKYSVRPGEELEELESCKIYTNKLDFFTTTGIGIRDEKKFKKVTKLFTNGRHCGIQSEGMANKVLTDQWKTTIFGKREQENLWNNVTPECAYTNKGNGRVESECSDSSSEFNCNLKTQMEGAASSTVKEAPNVAASSTVKEAPNVGASTTVKEELVEEGSIVVKKAPDDNIVLENNKCQVGIESTEFSNNIIHEMNECDEFTEGDNCKILAESQFSDSSIQTQKIVLFMSQPNNTQEVGLGKVHCEKDNFITEEIADQFNPRVSDTPNSVTNDKEKEILVNSEKCSQLKESLSIVDNCIEDKDKKSIINDKFEKHESNQINLCTEELNDSIDVNDRTQLVHIPNCYYMDLEYSGEKLLMSSSQITENETDKNKAECENNFTGKCSNHFTPVLSLKSSDQEDSVPTEVGSVQEEEKILEESQDDCDTSSYGCNESNSGDSVSDLLVMMTDNSKNKIYSLGAFLQNMEPSLISEKPFDLVSGHCPLCQRFIPYSQLIRPEKGPRLHHHCTICSEQGKIVETKLVYFFTVDAIDEFGTMIPVLITKTVAANIIGVPVKSYLKHDKVAVKLWSKVADNFKQMEMLKKKCHLPVIFKKQGSKLVAVLCGSIEPANP